jgi:hypothetical protein
MPEKPEPGEHSYSNYQNYLEALKWLRVPNPPTPQQVNQAEEKLRAKLVDEYLRADEKLANSGSSLKKTSSARKYLLLRHERKLKGLDRCVAVVLHSAEAKYLKAFVQSIQKPMQTDSTDADSARNTKLSKYAPQGQAWFSQQATLPLSIAKKLRLGPRN